MWEKFVAFIMSIVAFFSGLFGIDCDICSDYVFKNLAYGNHERQVLDLYLPEDSDGEVGLILYIHGGGWIAGDKDVYKNALKQVSKDYGYAAAAINYRYLSENVDMHDILDDISAAVKVIKDKGTEMDININKMLLTGGSAGGHLSMLYAYARANEAAITPAVVFSDCGPTDLTDENFFINNALGDSEFISQLFSYACGVKFTYAQRATAYDALMAVSPLYYVNENTVPTVINHGMKDDIVPFSNAQSLVAKLEEYGVTYEFIVYPNSGHGLDKDADCREKANNLLNQCMKVYLGVEPDSKW